ncbi:MAG: M56 family metallopeptidase, partial [Planctomycetota bacterium]
MKEDIPSGHSSTSWLAKIITATAAIWVFGSAISLLQIIFGWIRLRRILRGALPITNQKLQIEFHRACALVGCEDGRWPRLVSSNEISGPIAAGIFRGSVVLPNRLVAKVNPEDFADVLVHEVAHVIRRDPLVVLMQNLLLAFYWPHPLVRKLNQELAKAREEVCDNFVLASTNASVYSKNLLSLAEQVQFPKPIPGSVGFFTSRWKLEQRIADLLDETRDKQTFLTRRGWTLVFVSTIALLITICLGTVTIARAESSGQDSSEEASGEIKISGFVRDTTGNPIPRAKLWLAVTSFEFNSEINIENEDGLLREIGFSDELGKFELTLNSETVNKIRVRPRHAVAQLVATKDQYGLAWMRLEMFERTTKSNEDRELLRSRIDEVFGVGRFDARSLVLRPESEPVVGRLIDLEGNPVSGVKVSVESIREPPIAEVISAFENSWKRGFDEALNKVGVARGIARSELQKLITPITSDGDGKF